ncbi:LutC/YkgG family protein [Solitalea koreensis]|uniref:L-lactate dehydrogenase complex protein LldG n=1 Tax=Solitalea koreensis TaxID=543615 RepID=A0A521CL67_9SPHI|nr:LUD domain-containing protein [Solitalea koreensis]SMO60189.1 L-lactate dehydrogenase complex protein LldG [Solitalea koreensis]
MKPTTTPRERMLKNIRKALLEKRDNPHSNYEESPLYLQNKEMLEVMFAEELTKVAGNFVFCEDEIHFIENIIGLAEEKDWLKIICWDTKLQRLLRKYEYPFIANDKNFEKAEVGITLCEALIARNGSVLISSGQQSGRRLSIYPHVHIVLAYTSQLVLDLKDGFALVKEKYSDRLPSNITVTTGPSRTADIEKTLVLGAHGPKEFYVFLIDDIDNPENKLEQTEDYQQEQE